MRTLDLHEAADFLKIHYKTMERLARRGEVKGVKVGRAWVFLEIDLVDYLRELMAKQMIDKNTQVKKRGRPPERPPLN